MAQRDEIFQTVNLPDRDGEHQNHRESRIDCAGNEVGRENGGVPARDDADGEIKADHRVNREHQGRREAREQQVHGLVAMPVAGRSTPAEREHPIDHFHPAFL